MKFDLPVVTVAANDKVVIADTSDGDKAKTITAQSIADLATSTWGHITSPTAKITVLEQSVGGIDELRFFYEGIVPLLDIERDTSGSGSTRVHARGALAVDRYATFSGSVDFEDNVSFQAGVSFDNGINSTPIGATTPSTGVFTTLSATGAQFNSTLTVNGNATVGGTLAVTSNALTLGLAASADTTLTLNGTAASNKGIQILAAGAATYRITAVNGNSYTDFDGTLQFRPTGGGSTSFRISETAVQSDRILYAMYDDDASYSGELRMQNSTATTRRTLRVRNSDKALELINQAYTAVTHRFTNAGNLHLIGNSGRLAFLSPNETNNWHILANISDSTQDALRFFSLAPSASAAGYTLDIVHSGSHQVRIGRSVGAESASLEIGYGRTASGNAHIDLIGDTTYTDFGLRIVRSAGENGNSNIQHRGNGHLYLQTVESGRIILRAGNSSSRQVVVDAQGRLFGAALHNNAAGVSGTTNQFIASGTWTPTATNLTNMSSVEALQGQYIRVGNVVTFSIRILSDPVAAGAAAVFRLTLPIPSAFVNPQDAAGAGAPYPGNANKTHPMIVYADAATDQLRCEFWAADATQHDFFLTGSYLIQ